MYKSKLILSYFYNIILIYVGQIPLRQLVYRVNELPLSMRSLIFDFGGIELKAEQQYINKMVENKVSKFTLYSCKHLM